MFLNTLSWEFCSHRFSLKLKNCLVIFFAAVPVAAIDETIQIFTERGPAVKDVMIDICGYALGFMIVMLIKRYIGKKNKNLNYNKTE